VPSVEAFRKRSEKPEIDGQDFLARGIPSVLWGQKQKTAVAAISECGMARPMHLSFSPFESSRRSVSLGEAIRQQLDLKH
jgi:hypothetical protein